METLVKQYKGSINDPDNKILAYGELRLKTVGSDNNVVCSLKSAVAQTLKIISGTGVFRQSNDTELAYIQNQEQSPLTTANGDVISIENKYELVFLNGKSASGQNLKIEKLSDLSYSTKLQKLTFKEIGEGVTTDVANLTSLGTLHLASPNVGGSILDFSKLIALRDLDIQYAQITGKFETFIEQLITNGIANDANIVVNIMGNASSTGPTLHGIYKNKLKFAFNSTGCVVWNTMPATPTINATLSNGVWTDENGTPYVP